ncbi:MAG: hypothetical protein ACYDIE_05380 [Candidatus Krumholzibacteriia bacterium]
MRTSPRLVVIGAVCGCVLGAVGAAVADPCLVVYPDTPCVYHYSPSEYYVVGPGDPLYDPLHDRGGQVMLTVGTNEIDESVYQAPHISGFVADSSEQGYYFEGDQFDLIIDGFANTPTTYVNVLLVFDNPQPAGCVPQITVDGAPVGGVTWPLGDLVVRTPTASGNNYSDVLTRHVTWTGCAALHVWAFSDPDHNGVRTGRECFTAFSHDLTVPAREATWGVVKALYR